MSAHCGDLDVGVFWRPALQPGAMTTSSSLATVNMSTSTESEAVSLDSIPLYNIANLLWMVCPPVILVFGLFGNVMTLVIMYRMTSTQDSFAFPLYATSVAIADLTTNIVLVLPHWTTYALQYQLLATHTVVCKVFTWLQVFSGTAACWYLVLLSLHRAVSVVWPHRVNLVCTRRLVLVLLSTVTVFLAALYSHSLYGFDLSFSTDDSSVSCTMKNEAYIQFTEEVFVYMELVVYCLLPFVCLVLTNGVLVWKLTTSVRQARQSLSKGCSEQALARDKATRSVTLTVIVLSLTFLLLTLPWSICFILFFAARLLKDVNDQEFAQIHFFNTIAIILVYCNSAVNFYLYCLTGRRFREEFLKVLLCWKKAAGKETGQAQLAPGSGAQ